MNPAPTKTQEFVQGNQLSSADRSIAGVVQGITFHNEQTGYFVARVKVSGVRDEQTVLGSANSIVEGERLEAEGKWINSPSYGRQFKADTVRLSLPIDEAGLVKFLAGALPGIGPVSAGKIVKTFGMGISQIIEEAPERLLEVPGMTPKRAAAIVEVWTERGANHGVLSWLCGLGMSPLMAATVYKKLGKDVQAKITENPYILAEAISGIGFLKADAMAKKIGITPANAFRIRAALRHVLREATDSGSCGLPRKEVRIKAIGLLNFEPEGIDLIDKQIQMMLDMGYLAEAPASGVDCLFLANIYRWEQEIAIDLIERIRYGTANEIHDMENSIATAEGNLGITLAASQKAAVALSLREPVAVITGGPGTGKTTIIRAIVETFIAKGLEVLVCAPTGKAAKRASQAIGVEASTIHRLLEVKGNEFVHNRENPLECDALIVDELSMVDVALFKSLLAGVTPRARLILVGDVDQLPSVGPGKVLSDIITSKVVPTVSLTEVFRQAAESLIIMNAHRVNGGHAPTGRYVQGEDFGFFDLRDDDAAREALLRAATDMWRPGKFLSGKCYDPVKDVQVLSPMRRGKMGTDELNKELRARLNPNPPKEIHFRDGKLGVGDKVIQTKNNYDKAIFNGEIGYVVTMNVDLRSIGVDFDGRVVEYAAADLEQLRLAYALTIHRSQGSEFPVVLLAISYSHYVMLKRNLLYTGITRARELLLCFGNSRAAARAAQEHSYDERYSKLKDWLRNENLNNPSQTDKDLALAE